MLEKSFTFDQRARSGKKKVSAYSSLEEEQGSAKAIATRGDATSVDEPQGQPILIPMVTQGEVCPQIPAETTAQ